MTETITITEIPAKQIQLPIETVQRLRQDEMNVLQKQFEQERQQTLAKLSAADRAKAEADYQYQLWKSKQSEEDINKQLSDFANRNQEALSRYYENQYYSKHPQYAAQVALPKYTAEQKAKDEQLVKELKSLYQKELGISEGSAAFTMFQGDLNYGINQSFQKAKYEQDIKSATAKKYTPPSVYSQEQLTGFPTIKKAALTVPIGVYENVIKPFYESGIKPILSTPQSETIGSVGSAAIGGPKAVIDVTKPAFEFYKQNWIGPQAKVLVGAGYLGYKAIEPKYAGFKQNVITPLAIAGYKRYKLYEPKILGFAQSQANALRQEASRINEAYNKGAVPLAVEGVRYGLNIATYPARYVTQQTRYATEQAYQYAKPKIEAVKWIGENIVIPAAVGYVQPKIEAVVTPMKEGVNWLGEKVVVPTGKFYKKKAELEASGVGLTYQYAAKPVVKGVVGALDWLGGGLVEEGKGIYKGLDWLGGGLVEEGKGIYKGLDWLGGGLVEEGKYIGKGLGYAGSAFYLPMKQASKQAVQESKAYLSRFGKEGSEAKKQNGLVGVAIYDTGSLITSNPGGDYLNYQWQHSKYNPSGKSLAASASYGEGSLFGIDEGMTWAAKQNLDYELKKGELSTSAGRARVDKKWGTNFSNMSDEEIRQAWTTAKEEFKDPLLLRGGYGAATEVALESFGGWYGKGAVALLEAPSLVDSYSKGGLKGLWGENKGTIVGLGIATAGQAAPKLFSWGFSDVFAKPATATGLTATQKTLSAASPYLDKTLVPYLSTIAQVPAAQRFMSGMGEKIRGKISNIEDEIYIKPNVRVLKDAMDSDFKKKYGDDIKNGNMTYDDAFAKYSKTTEYNNYAKQIQSEYAKSESWWQGAKILGLQTIDWLTPENPEQALSFGAEYAATFRAIPLGFQKLGANKVFKTVSTYGLGGTALGTGASTFFKPAALKEERIKMGAIGILGGLGVYYQARGDIAYLKAKDNLTNWYGPSGKEQVGVSYQKQYGKKGLELSGYSPRTSGYITRTDKSGQEEILWTVDKDTYHINLPGGGKEWLYADKKGVIYATKGDKIFYKQVKVKNLKDYWNKLIPAVEKKEYGNSYSTWLKVTKLKPTEYKLYYDTMSPAIKKQYPTYNSFRKSAGSLNIRTMSTLDTARKEFSEELGLPAGKIFNKMQVQEQPYTGVRYNRIVKLDLTGIDVKVVPGSDTASYKWMKSSDVFKLINNREPSAWEASSVQQKGVRGVLRESFFRGGGRYDTDSVNIVLKEQGIESLKAQGLLPSNFDTEFKSSGDFSSGNVKLKSYTTKTLAQARKWISSNYGKQFVKTYTPDEAVKEYLLATKFPQFGTKGLAGSVTTYPEKFDKLIWYGTKTSPLRAVQLENGKFKSWTTKGQISRFRPGGKPILVEPLIRYAPGSRYRVDKPVLYEFAASKVPELQAHASPTGFPTKVGSIVVARGEGLQSGIFFQPPTFPGGQIYLGTSYLGGGKERGFTLIQGKPQISFQLGKPNYGQSTKMWQGHEQEAIEPGGTELQVIQKLKDVPFSGRAAGLIQFNKLAAKTSAQGSTALNIGQQVGVDIPFLEPFVTEQINVGGVTSTHIVPRTQFMTLPVKVSEETKVKPSQISISAISPSKVSVSPTISISSFPEISTSVETITPSSGGGGSSSSSIINPSPSPEPLKPSPDIFHPSPSGPSGIYGDWIKVPVHPSEEKKKKPIKLVKKKKPFVKGYLVLTYERKKPVLISQKPLIKSQAIGLGVRYTKGTERASFKLIPTSRPAIRSDIRPIQPTDVFKLGFRPQIRKGRFVPLSDVFIQRRPTRMGTRKEIKAIQSHRRGKSIW